MAIFDDVIVSSLNSADSASPDIAVDDSGMVHIAFMDKRSIDPGHENEATHKPNQWEIYTLSFYPLYSPLFKCLLFAYEKRRAYGDYTNKSDGHSIYPSIETTGSYWNVDTFISWHDDRNGNWDIYYSQMANNGNNPSSDIRVTKYANDDMYADIAVYGTMPDIKWQSKSLGWDVKNSYWKQNIKIEIDGMAHNLLPFDPDDNDSSDGVIYTYGLYLSPGNHNFSFSASNCLLTTNTSLFNWPIINDTISPFTIKRIGNPTFNKKISDQKQENYSMNDTLQPFPLHDHQSFVPSQCYLNAINISLVSKGNETGEIYVHLYDANLTQIARTFVNLDIYQCRHGFDLNLTIPFLFLQIKHITLMLTRDIIIHGCLLTRMLLMHIQMEQDIWMEIQLTYIMG